MILNNFISIPLITLPHVVIYITHKWQFQNTDRKYQYTQLTFDFMLSTRAVLSVIGATLVMISVGSLYTFGTLTPYIASYLHYHKNPDVSMLQISMINPISYVSMPIGMIAGSSLANRIDIRLIIISSFVIYGLVLLGLSYSDNLIGWVLGYGIGVGLCQGFPYMLPINNAYKYFPNKKGLISGICIGGLGFGALIWNQLIFALINPNNAQVDQKHHFPEDVANKLPYTIKIMACVYFGAALIGSVLITPFKKDKQQGLIQIPEPESQIALINYNNDCPSMSEALKSQMFYRLLILIALSSTFGIYIAFNYKQYGLSAINDDSFLTLAGSFGAIANGASRFVWGALFDILPFKFLLTFIELILLGMAITFPFVVHIKACFMLYLIGVYFAYGGLYAVFPSITYKIFGQLHGAKIYSLLFFGYSLGSIIQFGAHYYLVNRFNNDGHKYSFWIFSGFQGIAILLIIFSRWRVDWEQKKRQSLLTDRDQ